MKKLCDQLCCEKVTWSTISGAGLAFDLCSMAPLVDRTVVLAAAQRHHDLIFQSWILHLD